MITAHEENVVSTLVPQRCGECGVLFGMEKEFRDKRVEDHRTWHCPNGHTRSFIAETEAERLKRQLQLTETCLANTRNSLTHMGARARSAERSVQARKGVVTRMKRRITKGRCVCCSKQFKDLEAHMKENHPKWNPEKAAEALTEKAEK